MDCCLYLISESGVLPALTALAEINPPGLLLTVALGCCYLVKHLHERSGKGKISHWLPRKITTIYFIATRWNMQFSSKEGLATSWQTSTVNRGRMRTKHTSKTSSMNNKKSMGKLVTFEEDLLAGCRYPQYNCQSRRCRRATRLFTKWTTHPDGISLSSQYVSG